ncbi:MAG: phage integrase SAM-like domain-containing protein [Alistipes sp.]|nr:phage integrase SAM-like domain-containing protein [Alistipes sp.]
MASVSFKAVVYSHHKKKDGTYNVKIRVTHKRQTRQVPTNLTVTSEDLTRGKLRIKNEQIITQTDQLIRRWRTIVNNLGMVLDNLNVDEVIKYIQEKERDGDSFRLDFFEYGEKVAAGKSEGTAGNYRTALNCLRRFVGSGPLDISLITGKFLQDFEAYIVTEPVLKYSRKDGVKSSDKSKAGGRAVSSYMECLRSIHNEAKREFNDEDIGVIRIPQSPFKKYKVKKPHRGNPARWRRNIYRPLSTCRTSTVRTAPREP